MSDGQGSNPKSKDMRLKIVGCRQVYSGRNQRGDSYTIFEIDAERAADGVRINQKLRSFTALPIGQVVEVTVTPFKSTKHGKSFTLAPKNNKGAGSGSTQRVNELAEQVEECMNRIANLTRRLGEVESRLGEVMKDDARFTRPAAQPTTAQAANSRQLDEKFGADPPEGETW